jgi:hypothetical protein
MKIAGHSSFDERTLLMVSRSDSPLLSRRILSRFPFDDGHWRLKIEIEAINARNGMPSFYAKMESGFERSTHHHAPIVFLPSSWREKRSYRRDTEKRYEGTLPGRAAKLLSSALC